MFFNAFIVYLFYVTLVRLSLVLNIKGNLT